MSRELPVLAAIDVGSNAVRLKLARALPDGSFEILHQERDPVRPGEGVFETGVMSRKVADRLLATLRRYGALCRRHEAHVRAVATSAVREAGNRDQILKRVRKEARINLEVVSGKEEARLICLGVLSGAPPIKHAMCVDIGGGSTEVGFAASGRLRQLFSLQLGAVRLTEMFGSGDLSTKKFKLMREVAEQTIAESLPSRSPFRIPRAFGSSGTINAVVAFASGGESTASRRQLKRATAKLQELGENGRRRYFDARRADIVLAGAVILDAFARHFDLDTIVSVPRGLRDGVLVDLVEKQRKRGDHSLYDAALEMGRRFRLEERHATQVSRLSVELFDALKPLHELPDSARPHLEVAALLHDVGNAVSYQRHHKHTYYLIQNADLPGVADRERELIARIARFHRRSNPDPAHAAMSDLLPDEADTVRKLATLLRVADALDRSHHQPVRALHARFGRKQVVLHLGVRGPIDLELWDLQKEMDLFEEVFGRELVVQTRRG